MAVAALATQRTTKRPRIVRRAIKPGFTGGLGSVFSSFAIVFGLILVVSVGVVQFAHLFASGRGSFGNSRLAAESSRITQSFSRLKIVKLTTTTDCSWSEATSSLQVGNAIPAGRAYELYWATQN